MTIAHDYARVGTFNANVRGVGYCGRPATPAAPIPYQDIGALIGKIGDGAPFAVGASLSGFRAATAGRLRLRVNDDVMTDNRGQFRATVTVTRR